MSIQIHPIQVLNKTSIRNQNKSVDIIENGITEVKADKGYTGINKVTINVDVPSSGNLYTGHADVEGLKAIGWTDEDIAYYQEHGVNWNEEEDDNHKVKSADKSMFYRYKNKIVTTSDIADYANAKYIEYLPKINTSDITNFSGCFAKYVSLKGIPYIDTSAATTVQSMFSECRLLTCVPPLDLSNTTTTSGLFKGCVSLTTVPQLDLSNCTDTEYMFENCYNLEEVPTLDLSKVTKARNMFYNCINLRKVFILNTSAVERMDKMFYNCSKLLHVTLSANRCAFYSETFRSCTNLISISFIDCCKDFNGYVYFDYTFYNCHRLKSIYGLEFRDINTLHPKMDNTTFTGTYSLQNLQIKNADSDNLYLEDCVNLSMKSLVFIIETYSSGSVPLLIYLHPDVYKRADDDDDVLDALDANPLVSIAKK